jgi:protease-4
MSARQYTAVLVWVWSLLFVTQSGQADDSRRAPFPEGLFYYQPSATVFGSAALWTNPARLSMYNATSYELLADYFDGHMARSWGYAFSRDRFSLAYRYLDRPGEGVYREFAWGGGFALPGGAELGLSYRYFTDAPGIYKRRHYWNIGASGAYGPSIRWGAVFSNLNRGRIDGERSETEMRYSLAYRPFGPNLTLAIDMLLSTGSRLASADYTYHVEVKPIPGLLLYGAVDSDRNYQIGFRVNLRQSFLGSRSRFNRDGDGRGTTFILGGTSMKQPSLIKDKVRRLAVGITGGSSENPVRPVFGNAATPFVTTLTTLYRAAGDPSIGEVSLDLNGLQLGFGQAQELRQAIIFCRSHGKEVVCYLRAPNNISYYVASAATKIYIPPVAQLKLVGLRAELTFYAGTLDKLGVRLDLLQVGDYKSAPETYTRSSASEENREQVNRLLDDLYAQFLADIAEGRGITVDSAASLVDRGPYTSAEALEYGLVDGLSYRDDFPRDYLTAMPQISLRRYIADTLINEDWRPRSKIALVVAEGEIARGGTNNPFMPSSNVTPGEMKRAFERASADGSVKGIVFRIDSPGGEALAGDDIYHAAATAAEKKPMAVSMASVAASGGYYAAMAAPRVFADPGTITGSIGVFGGKADFSGLYEKFDVGKELYTRGRFAGMLSSMRPFTDEERRKYYSQLEALYDHFVGLVADNRALPVDSVGALSGGRVWTGREARSNGLVDELGGLKESIDFVAEAAGLADYSLVIFPERRPLFVLPKLPLIGSISSLLGTGDTSPARALETVLQDDISLLARMPYDITVE